MHFHKFSLILLVTFYSATGFCQEDSIVGEERSSNLKLSYNSSLIYPGARIGIESPIARTYLTKSLKSGDKKEYIKDQFITTNIFWYHQPNFHDNIYFTVGWTARKTRSNGVFTEFSPEIGYSRTFLGGTTYKVDNSGNVTIEKLAGYNYLIASVGGGVGYDFSVVKSKPFSVFYKLNLLTMDPYNSTVYMRPAMELGLIYKPKDFLSFKVKSRRIYK